MQLQMFKDYLKNSAKLLKGVSEDQDVVQVHTYMPLHDEILEDIVYHDLECRWTVGESKEHNKRLKEAMVCV